MSASTAARIALRVIEAIKADWEAHYLPAEIHSLSQLHDIVDANEYFIVALEAEGMEFDASSEEQAAITNQAQRNVDVWLKARP